MNLYIALSLFSVIILIYLVITELFTILFRFTGLPDERARFQVISLLTGILVMLVERQGEKPAAAGADTVFAPGDKLTVFGSYAAICKAFHARERFVD